MGPSDADAQDAGTDPEPERRLQDRGLAVDACGNRIVRVDLELRSRPFAPRTLRERPGLRAAWRRYHRDAEQAVVDPRPGARSDRPPSR